MRRSISSLGETSAMAGGETGASEVQGLPQRRTRDTLGLLTLLLVGWFFLPLWLPGGYRIYLGVVFANWVVLFAVALGRWHARRGRIWLLVTLSPLCLLGVVLLLTLLSRRVRGTAGRDLAAAVRGIWSRLSFPLGAPTVGKLILAVVISAAVFVSLCVLMGSWLAFSGANPSTTFWFWWIFALPGVLAVLTLSYLVAGWLRARRSGQEEPGPDSRPDCG